MNVSSATAVGTALPPEVKPSRGVVTFLDVLGWKGIYNREDDPIAKLSSLIEGLTNFVKKYRGLPFTIEIQSISDTIVIYSTRVDKEAKQVIEAHGEVCAKAIADSITVRIPVRGATAFGEFEVQGNIYVGKAIDEAASWYEVGDWIGVHLTPSAMLAVDDELKNWTKYEPPLKLGGRQETHCVRWDEAWMVTVPGQDPINQLKAAFMDMGPIMPDYAGKFANTMVYFKKILNAKGNGVAS